MAMGHRILDPATFDTSKSSKIWRWSKFSVHFPKNGNLPPLFVSPVSFTATSWRANSRDGTGASPAVRLPVPLFHGASHAGRPGGDPAERRHPTPDLGHEQLPPGRREVVVWEIVEKKDQEAVGDVAFIWIYDIKNEYIDIYIYTYREIVVNYTIYILLLKYDLMNWWSFGPESLMS